MILRVKAGSRRDELWREGTGLYAQIRIDEQQNDTEAYLAKFLSGSLRVDRGLIAIRSGSRPDQRTVEIKLRDTDIQPILDTLPVVPAARLFDDV